MEPTVRAETIELRDSYVMSVVRFERDLRHRIEIRARRHIEADGKFAGILRRQESFRNIGRETDDCRRKSAAAKTR